MHTVHRIIIMCYMCMCVHESDLYLLQVQCVMYSSVCMVYFPYTIHISAACIHFECPVVWWTSSFGLCCLYVQANRYHDKWQLH